MRFILLMNLDKVTHYVDFGCIFLNKPFQSHFLLLILTLLLFKLYSCEFFFLTELCLILFPIDGIVVHFLIYFFNVETSSFESLHPLLMFFLLFLFLEQFFVAESCCFKFFIVVEVLVCHLLDHILNEFPSDELGITIQRLIWLNHLAKFMFNYTLFPFDLFLSIFFKENIERVLGLLKGKFEFFIFGCILRDMGNAWRATYDRSDFVGNILKSRVWSHLAFSFHSLPLLLFSIELSNGVLLFDFGYFCPLHTSLELFKLEILFTDLANLVEWRLEFMLLLLL